MDEYYDKITGNPKYALHGMCNPLMIWQQRKAETDGLDAYKARNISITAFSAVSGTKAAETVTGKHCTLPREWMPSS